MSLISKLFRNEEGGGLVSSIGNIVDNLTTTKSEKMQLDLEIKKAEWQFINDNNRLKVISQQNLIQDKNSARLMSQNIQTNDKSTHLNKNISAYLALTTTALTFTLFFVILFFPEKLQDKGKDIIIYILGVLSAIVTQVFSFYFGSSLNNFVGTGSGMPK